MASAQDVSLENTTDTLSIADEIESTNNLEINEATTVEDNVANEINNGGDVATTPSEENNNEYKTFSELNSEITNQLVSGNTVTLDYDYKNTDSYSAKGITITQSNIVINGQGHTIDGNNAGRIFYITGNNITLKNLIFINGNYAASGEGGGAIQGAVGDLIINNCSFINNTATNQGGAIRGGNGDTTIINSTFTNNTATKDGGAIYSYGKDFIVINSTFTNNRATESGGAIMTANNNDFKVSNTKFANNKAYEDL